MPAGGQAGGGELTPGRLATPQAREPRGPALLHRARFALLACPALAAAAALAARTAYDVFEIVSAVIVGDFFVRLDIAQCPDEYAATIRVALRVRIAGMVGVA